jgi:hypothetical protein
MDLVNISDAIDPVQAYSHFIFSVYDPDPIGFVDPDLDLEPGRQNYLQKRKNTEIS